MEKTDRPYESDQLFLLSALDQQIRQEMQVELKSIQKRLPVRVRGSRRGSCYDRQARRSVAHHTISSTIHSLAACLAPPPCPP